MIIADDHLDVETFILANASALYRMHSKRRTFSNRHFIVEVLTDYILTNLSFFLSRLLRLAAHAMCIRCTQKNANYSNPTDTILWSFGFTFWLEYYFGFLFFFRMVERFEITIHLVSIYALRSHRKAQKEHNFVSLSSTSCDRWTTFEWILSICLWWSSLSSSSSSPSKSLRGPVNLYFSNTYQPCISIIVSVCVRCACNTLVYAVGNMYGCIVAWAQVSEWHTIAVMLCMFVCVYCVWLISYSHAKTDTIILRMSKRRRR